MQVLDFGHGCIHQRLLALLLAPLLAATLGCPPEPLPVEPQRPQASVLPAGVCGFNAFTPGMQGVKILQTLGSAAEDQVFAEEVAIQHQWYQMPTTYWILDDGSPRTANAYASPRGYVLFGIHMYRKTISTYGGSAIAGVLAHEGGHRVQQVAGWSNSQSVLVTELEADAFSGFYMAIVKRRAWSQVHGYFAHTYASGDYYFNDPQHHGTPSQRLAAAYMGVNLADYALTQPRPPTWSEMHAIFMQGMPQILGSAVLANRAVASGEAALPGSMAAMIARLPLAEIATGRIRGSDVVMPSEQAVARPWSAPGFVLPAAP